MEWNAMECHWMKFCTGLYFNVSWIHKGKLWTKSTYPNSYNVFSDLMTSSLSFGWFASFQSCQPKTWRALMLGHATMVNGWWKMVGQIYVLLDLSCLVLSVPLCWLTLSPISRQAYMTEQKIIIIQKYFSLMSIL